MSITDTQARAAAICRNWRMERKAEEWEGPLARPLTHEAAVILDLPRIKISPEASPMDPVPGVGSRTGVICFVAEVDGDRWLVNTEGFDYCRYICLLPVAMFAGEKGGAQ